MVSIKIYARIQINKRDTRYPSYLFRPPGGRNSKGLRMRALPAYADICTAGERIATVAKPPRNDSDCWKSASITE